MQNSAFGLTDSNDTSQAGNQLDDAKRPTALTLNVKAICGSKLSAQNRVNVLGSIAGVAAVLQPHSPAETVVALTDAENRKRIRADLINHRRLKLPLENLSTGTYQVTLCEGPNSDKCITNAQTIHSSQEPGESAEYVPAALGVVAQFDLIITTDMLHSGESVNLLPTVSALLGRSHRARPLALEYYRNFPEADLQAIKERSANNSLLQSCDQSIGPLVVNMDNRGIQLNKLIGGALFDLDANGVPEQLSWPGKQSGFLALDLNGNNFIDNGAELFARGMPMHPDGNLAPNGFAALKRYDSDGDLRLTAADPVFDRIRVWFDDNQDGWSQDSELHTLSELAIVALQLIADPGWEQDSAGNTTTQRSTARTADGRWLLVVDLFMRRL